ncbi:hypothetical protein [Nonomuraea sp. KM88]
MQVLVLSGPPAAGKSTVGRRVAGTRARCAFIDVDDVRSPPGWTSSSPTC